MANPSTPTPSPPTSTAARTCAESRRKSEVSSIASTEVVDDYTIKINLTAPDATLLAQLADRAGMMLSPKAAAEAAGADFGLQPGLLRPVQLQGAGRSRTASCWRRFADYWNADAINFDTRDLPADPRHHRASGQPARRRSGHARASGGDRCRLGQGAMTAWRWSRRSRSAIRAITINVGNGERAEQPAGSGCARAPGAVAVDRP